MKESQSIWRSFKLKHNWQRNTAQILLYVVLGIIFFVILMGHVKPKSYHHLQIGAISEERIVSPITILDEAATARAREEAASSVEPVLTVDQTITEIQLKLLDNIFENIKEINGNAQLSQSEKIEELKKKIPYQLTDESYNTLVTMQEETMNTMQLVTRYIVESIMQEGVDADNKLAAARESVSDTLVRVELARSARVVTQELARNSIIPNIKVDIQRTNQLREEAKAKVEPIYIVKDDVILDFNERITSEHLRKLKLVGLIGANSLKPYFGLGILVFIMLIMIRFFIKQANTPTIQQTKSLLLYFLIIILNLLLMKIITLGQSLEYEAIGYIAPVAFGSMLVSILLSRQLAYFSSILFALPAGILFNENSLQLFDFHYAFVALIGSVVGAYVVGSANTRTNILKAGFWISLANLIVLSSLILLSNQDFIWSKLLLLALYAVLSGLLSGVFALGFMPFFEAAFGILSSVKLIELSNPNQPLLRKLLVETPGTYHHSVIVGNLAEAAAEAIGANGLLARVGSYYHDIGKTKRPTFFIENQVGIENPHDKISPQLSKTIITAHPYDGVKMLKEYKMPKAICDIAEQHHGTSLLKYFYHKALQENDQVREEDFRYPGPKAQFKEAAIIGICDSVEAAVRSLSKPTPERIESLVRKIIKERLDDGQFDECDLTLKELDIIHRAIVETLHGTFHTRIEYPNDEAEVKQA